MVRRKTLSNELRPVIISQELKTLSRFFPKGKGKLEGILEAGLLGPDAPEVREDGKFESKWVMDGVYCVLTYDVYLYEGAKKTEQSQGLCVMGWDTNAGEYRMLRAANLGVMFQLNGRLKGNVLEFTSDETKIKGSPTRVRYTFIKKRSKAVVWLAELSVRRGPWRVVGEDTLTYF